MALCERPSTNDSVTTARCSSGSSASTAPTRFWRSLAYSDLVGGKVAGGLLEAFLGQLLPGQLAAQPVDAQVAGDGEDPGGDAAAIAGVEGGLAPDGEQGVLDQVVGGGRIRPAAHHVGFHARAIGLIKLAKCGGLRLLRHTPQQIRHDAKTSPGRGPSLGHDDNDGADHSGMLRDQAKATGRPGFGSPCSVGRAT